VESTERRRRRIAVNRLWEGQRLLHSHIDTALTRGAAVAFAAALICAAPSGQGLADEPAKPAETVAEAEARSFADIVLKMEGDAAYGEYLAGECVTCHRASGAADGIPPIVGLPKDYFVQALFEYKTNVRSNEVMKLRVVNLANDEIAALAAYFSSPAPQ
jgi:cytochrome c